MEHQTSNGQNYNYIMDCIGDCIQGIAYRAQNHRMFAKLKF
jgi:hypothetical protein